MRTMRRLLALLLVVSASSPMAQSLAYIGGGFQDVALRVVDLRSGRLVRNVVLPNLGPQGFDRSRDGRYLWVAHWTTNASVSVIDTLDDRVVANIPLGADRAQSVTLSPNGREAWVAAVNAVVVIDTTTFAVLATLPGIGVHVAFSPDGSRVYVSGGDRVDVYDRATRTITSSIPFTFVFSTTVSADGTRVFAAGASLWEIDSATGTVLRSLDPDGDSRFHTVVTLHPQGSWLYADSYGGQGIQDQVVQIDLASFTVLRSAPLVGQGGGIDFTQNGQTMVVVDLNGPPQIFDSPATLSGMRPVSELSSGVSFGRFVGVDLPGRPIPASSNWALAALLALLLLAGARFVRSPR